MLLLENWVLDHSIAHYISIQIFPGAETQDWTLQFVVVCSCFLFIYLICFFLDFKKCHYALLHEIIFVKVCNMVLPTPCLKHLWFCNGGISVRLQTILWGWFSLYLYAGSGDESQVARLTWPMPQPREPLSHHSDLSLYYFGLAFSLVVWLCQTGLLMGSEERVTGRRGQSRPLAYVSCCRGWDLLKK